jgi:hypothetical protein
LRLLKIVLMGAEGSPSLLLEPQNHSSPDIFVQSESTPFSAFSTGLNTTEQTNRFHLNNSHVCTCCSSQTQARN